ncbi:MAG: hypothetical protein PHH93_13975 [Prolixibacteraceae bacterium]|nr:hypothetical protein [Prolixibacteraceae bacterium]
MHDKTIQADIINVTEFAEYLREIDLQELMRQLLNMFLRIYWF